ncbi:MAG: 3-oxoacyl-ACP synthase III family protein [Akkermansia sp.]
MAFFSVNRVAIRGISACVPKEVEENSSLPFYAPGEAEQVIAATGIERRHIAPPGSTASDLCCKAAQTLLDQLGWEKDSVDLLAFCTQTPDYINHPDSFVVHETLGLPESTVCLDYYHGCPGWVTSLSSVASMVQSGQIKRALLLDGDAVSKRIGKDNRESRPLFGDAGIATALEYDEKAAPMHFHIGSLSKEGRAIASPLGGARSPHTMQSYQRFLDILDGKIPFEQYTSKMDSMDVFAFAITKIPKALKKLCAHFGINPDSADRLVLHQANKLIVEHIAKRMRIPMERVPLSLRNYGNTTSASVPMALVSECAEALASGKQRLLLCAFGTGLAYAAAYLETDHILCPPIDEL